jgi:hypothetical protein
MSQKNKMVKITADFVIDEYLKAKQLKGIKKKNAMAKVKFLSQNLNKFVPPTL